MQRKDYPAAIESYSKAIAISPLNPIYLSNRAAAYSASHQHAQASTDAEMAVAADPSYTKAWSRLGLARYVLGDAKGSMEAYGKGIEYEGNGGSEAMKKGYKTAKERFEKEEKEKPADEDEDEDEDVEESARGGGAPAGGMPDLSALAGMLGGGRGGGGGGMPGMSCSAAICSKLSSLTLLLNRSVQHNEQPDVRKHGAKPHEQSRSSPRYYEQPPAPWASRSLWWWRRWRRSCKGCRRWSRRCWGHWRRWWWWRRDARSGKHDE